MKRTAPIKSGVSNELIHDHARVIERLHHFRNALTNFRYEGIPVFGRNLKALQELRLFLEKDILTHLKLEENVVFPFLKKRLPKFDRAINFIYSEHQDFRKSLVDFKKLLSAQKGMKARTLKSRGELLSETYKVGHYLIAHLINHLKMENASVYSAIGKELSESEGHQLQKQIRRWENK